MGKIKVCHIAPMGMGGIPIFICNLLENTDFNKYEVTIIHDWPALSEPIASRLKKLPVHIDRYDSRNRFGKYQRLNKIFRENKFDVCHIHYGEIEFLFSLIALLNGIPIRIAHSHTTLENSPNRKKRHNFFSFYQFARTIYHYVQGVLVQINKRCATCFLACSEEAAEKLFTPSIVHKKRYAVIPNGIDLERFSKSNSIRHESTEVLFVGRLVREKNPIFAIHVFAEYLKKDPTAHFTMIGRGYLNNNVRAEIERLNLSKQIDLVPITGEILMYYHAADLLLLPSLYEGLGIVLIEAQAAGVKCLTSDAVPQLAQCGLVEYKPLANGPEAWAGYMSELLRNDNLKVDQEKLMFFDIKNTVRMIDEVYRL